MDATLGWFFSLLSQSAPNARGSASFHRRVENSGAVRRAEQCSAAEGLTLVEAAGIDCVASFIMSFVLLHAVHYAGAVTLGTGAAVGFFNWLGFLATVTLGLTLYEGRPL